MCVKFKRLYKFKRLLRTRPDTLEHHVGNALCKLEEERFNNNERETKKLYIHIHYT